MEIVSVENGVRRTMEETGGGEEDLDLDVDSLTTTVGRKKREREKKGEEEEKDGKEGEGEERCKRETSGWKVVLERSFFRGRLLRSLIKPLKRKRVSPTTLFFRRIFF